MQRQVVGAGEAAAARGALEGLHPGVFPEVASQLVGARKAPRASLPGAAVRFLSFSRRGEEKKMKARQMDDIIIRIKKCSLKKKKCTENLLVTK